MVYFIAGSACSDRLFKPYVHLEFLRKGSYRMDFKYEMVVPNEDLPCKFFIFEGKTAITAAPTLAPVCGDLPGAGRGTEILH